MAIFGFGKRARQQASDQAVRVNLADASGAVKTAPSADIRPQLFKAACLHAKGDELPLRAMCKNHARLIRAQVALPILHASIRANPALRRWYRDGLIAIADFCESSGRNAIETRS
jgi:hypothetical protein